MGEKALLMAHFKKLVPAKLSSSVSSPPFSSSMRRFKANVQKARPPNATPISSVAASRGPEGLPWKPVSHFLTTQASGARQSRFLTSVPG